MSTRLSVDSNRSGWQPAGEVLSGYVLGADGTTPTNDPDAGIFLKVLRSPQDGGGCWHVLLRFRPPAGKAIRITAIARSDEEVFILTGDRAGQYTCNPKGLRHGQTITEDTTVLVHYHDAPDEVLRAEVIELAAST